MSYLITKKQDSQGCIGLNVTRFKELDSFVLRLNRIFLNKGLQFFIVQNLIDIEDYKPYRFVETEEEFVCEIKLIINKGD